jgi:uncharacterized phage-like protein YoqJ
MGQSLHADADRIVVAGTGHRPQKLNPRDEGDRSFGFTREAQAALLEVSRGALARIQEEHPEHKITVITGMALGYDQSLAVAALEADMHVVAAVPFAGQEKAWRPESQREYHALLDRIREGGGEVHVISPGGYSPAKMQARNVWMVDRAHIMLALDSGRRGGTANCLEYAKERGREIVNVWRDYESRVSQNRELPVRRVPVEPARGQQTAVRDGPRINIVHVRDHLDARGDGVVYVGRRLPAHGLAASPLANSFHVGPDGTREEVVERYRGWLRAEYARPGSRVRGELLRIRDLVVSGRDVSLAVWKSPQEGHVEVVRAAVERLVERERARQQVLAGGVPAREGARAADADHRPQHAAHASPTGARETTAPAAPSARAQQAHHDLLVYNPATDNYRELFEPGDGRNRAEHASYLDGRSKSARDAFERGAGVYDGALVVPKEFDSPKREGAITTRRYAVSYVSAFVKDDAAAREKAAELVLLGEQISGSLADSKARIAVFKNLYEQIGYDELGRAREVGAREAALDETLERARSLAGEMLLLEPQEHAAEEAERDEEHSLEFGDFERGASDPDHLRDENESYARAYEEAVAGVHEHRGGYEHVEVEARDLGGAMPEVAYERIDLDEQPPAVPDAISLDAEERLLAETLPEVDRRLEAGESRGKILGEVVYAPHRAGERADKTARVSRAFAARSPEAARNTPPGRAEELQALITLHVLATGEAARESKRFSPGALATLRAVYSGRQAEHHSPRLSAADTRRSAAHPATAPQARDYYTTREKEIRLAQQKLLRLDRVPTRGQVERVEGLERAAANIAGAVERRRATEAERARALDVVAGRVQAAVSGESQRLTTFERAAATRHRVEARLGRPLAHASLDAYLRDELAEARGQIATSQREYLARTGRTPDTPEQARESVAAHVAALVDAGERVAAERSRTGVPPAREAEKFREPHVFVSLNNDSSHRLPVGSAREHATVTRFAEAAGLHVNTWHGLHGREITGRSEEREQIALFVGGYINHRLRDAETRALNQNAAYREYAGRLDAARSVEELRATANEIRRENYRRSEQQKAHRLDPERAARPDERALTAREMSQLFLSAAPAHYTKEMRDLRHNLSVTGREKENLIRGLERGEIAPSKQLSSLLRELDTRRSPEAVCHFVRSLTKPAAEMQRPSSFDLHAVHQSLLPYEKDYLYRVVSARRDEFRDRQLQKQTHATAERRQDAARPHTQATPERRPAREVTATQTFRTYYAEATWREARLFTAERARRIEGHTHGGSRSSIVEGIPDRHIAAAGYVIHNTDAKKAQEVAAHLKGSADRSLRMTGEIIDAFSRVRRDARPDGRVELSLTTPERSEIGRQGWSRLLEHLHPDRSSDNIFLRDKLPESHLAEIRREAQRSAWQELETSSRPSYSLDTRADVLYGHAEVSAALDYAQQQQERARTAHHTVEGHVEAVSARVEKELAHSLSAEQPGGREAADRNTTRDLVRAALDPRHAAERGRLIGERARELDLIRKAVTPAEHARYDGLSKYSERAKDDYLRSMGELDERMRSLAEAVRQDEARRGTASAREDSAHGREAEGYRSASREQYGRDVQAREAELLSEKIEEMIRAGTVPARAEGGGDLRVKDLMPPAERQSLSERAREEAWWNLVPEELRGEDSCRVEGRVLDQAVQVGERISGARETERELAAAREALAAYDAAAQERDAGAGHGAERAELAERVAAAESRLDLSFAEIDREQAGLDTAREEVQLVERAELFEALRDPLELRMRDYLDAAYRQEGLDAFRDSERAEEHAAGLSKAVRDCFAEHGLTLEQLNLNDKDVEQIAHSLVASLSNTLDRAQAHALHQDVMRAVPERGTEHLTRSLEALTNVGNEQHRGDFAQERLARERNDRDAYEIGGAERTDGAASQSRGPQKEHEEATRDLEQIEISRDASEQLHDLAFLLH